MVPSLWMMWDSMCFRWKESPYNSLKPFHFDIYNDKTSRVLCYRFAAVVADVSQMFWKTNREGPGSLTNIDEVARLTGDGIHQVVALTRESPLDRHGTIRTSNAGVSAQNRSSSLSVFVLLETYRFPPWFDYSWLTIYPSLILPGTLDSVLSENCPWRSSSHKSDKLLISSLNVFVQSAGFSLKT